jgi:hypothetical protein
MERMPNLTHEEWSIRYHRDEIDSLRRQMGPGMLLTADGRLDIERRIAENEQWLERWLGAAKYRAQSVASITSGR